VRRGGRGVEGDGRVAGLLEDGPVVGEGVRGAGVAGRRGQVDLLGRAAEPEEDLHRRRDVVDGAHGAGRGRPAGLVGDGDGDRGVVGGGGVVVQVEGGGGEGEEARGQRQRGRGAVAPGDRHRVRVLRAGVEETTGQRQRLAFVQGRAVGREGQVRRRHVA